MREIVVYVRSRDKYGDQIVSYATLYQVKRWWPEARLRVVVQHEVEAYYRQLPWVDECIRARGISEMVRALPLGADMVICLHHTSERYALISLLRGAKIRVGYSNGRLCDWAWTHARRKDINEYIGLANLYLLDAFRPVQAEVTSRLCFEKIAALSDVRPTPADIVFIPGGGDGDFKRWGVQNYVALAEILKRTLGPSARFAFVLGPAESLERRHLQALNRPEFDLIDGCAIPELAALMLRARLIVANDCGPSHIAQGVCVPYVGVFNEPNPEWFWDRTYAASVSPASGVGDIRQVEPERVAQACYGVMQHAPVRNYGSSMPT